jgi:hypothetical protein
MHNAVPDAGDRGQVGRNILKDPPHRAVVIGWAAGLTDTFDLALGDAPAAGVGQPVFHR